MTGITLAHESRPNLSSMHKPMEIKRIFHPTNLEEEAMPAFYHALGLTVAASATLTLMHVGSSAETSVQELPQVRSTLKRWGVITEAHGSKELRDMGIGVRKILEGGDPLQACLAYLKDHRADLVVLHTHQRDEAMDWLGRRVAEPLMREAHLPTLIVPSNAQGFFDPSSGVMRMQRILLPIASTPSPSEAIALASWIAEVLKVDDARFMLLSIGGDDFGHVIDHAPQRPGWEWSLVQREGEVVDGILHAALEWKPDLIVMPTQGHDGFLDALRGSTTERVLRRIRCPMLTKAVSPV